MNCHENNNNNNNNQGTQKHSPLKHMMHMLICCGLPIVVIGLLPLITRFSPSAAGVLARIAPFLCPLMMIGMMVMMMGGSKKGSCCDNTKPDNISGK